MSIISGVINWSESDPEVLKHLINVNRPYNKEKRDLKSYVNFGVISKYFADRCLEDFKDREHKEALKIHKEMN